MHIDRRNWLKQLGIGVSGIGLANFETLVTPTADFFESVVGDSPINLNSNENPYGPSPLARAAMAKSINSSNRYNWQLTSDLVEVLAKKNKVSAKNILIGAGSTEIIDLVVRLSASTKGNLVTANPSYDNWIPTAKKLGLQAIKVPLNANKELNLEAMLQAINSDTRLVYVCNPNNPTGTICEYNKLLNFIHEASKKAIVLVDEAYLDFSKEQSLGPLVVGNKNLIVAKTFSKLYGLAGARIGYAIGEATTLEQLGGLQSWVSGSISVVSAAAALASLTDEKFMAETSALNEQVKKYTIEQLKQLNLACIPTHANFVYFSLENYKQDYFQKLSSNKIIGTRIYEEAGQWTRITIGTREEMERFIGGMG
ncbi:histidinol-phosphate transaminase [Haliscomenobacter sp.]|uniref:pyridoxal phosphate-dependent aminotransferase n=1 Tax=Haliscomenobacter sp. TaxID=2717303 RepID=UPI003593598C